jgi:dynein intermediate chain 2
MQEYEHIYMKKRKEFGRYCNFEDVEPKVLGQVDCNPVCGDMYIEQTILNLVLDNIPQMSEAEVNTARVQTKNRSMLHAEGGWPKDIEASETQDTMKWRKKNEKDPAFLNSVKQLTKQTVMCLEQNVTIDLFQHYFLDEEPDFLPQDLTMKTVALFKDPAEEKRSVTKIGFHPDASGPSRLVGSYSNLRFQRMTEEMPMASFIWDISERNVPLTELRSHSPMVCCQFNTKQSDWLLGGCYNGILNWYDLKRGPTPCMKSKVEVSHYDPVYDVVWMQSKTGQDCASVSSDGRLLFWDCRKLDEFVDECILTDGGPKESEKTLGGCSLEWMQEAGPTKFLVGTEHGITLSCSRKPKKACEIGTWFGAEARGGYGKHFGPVYAVKRNPFHVKFFLTVGDWCCKMWMEELKGPMLKTPYYPAFLSAASWSPTRAGVFYLCRHDGYIDTWDYYYRMNEVSLTQKVSDAALTSISIQNQGSLMAVGDADGCITLMQLCDSLVNMAPNEKNMIGQMFDRETKREKNLEAIKKLGGAAKKQGEGGGGAAGICIDETEYTSREKAFFHDVGMTGDDLGTTLNIPASQQVRS